MDALRSAWFLICEKLVDGIERDIKARRNESAFKALNVLDLIDTDAAAYYREEGWRVLTDEGKSDTAQSEETVSFPRAIYNPIFGESLDVHSMVYQAEQGICLI